VRLDVESLVNESAPAEPEAGARATPAAALAPASGSGRLSAWGDVHPCGLAPALAVTTHPRFAAPLIPNVREARLLNDAPWVRGVGPLELRVQTEGWKFPAPPIDLPPRPIPEPKPERPAVEGEIPVPPLPDQNAPVKPPPKVRPKPTADTVLFKDRLLYLLQPPID